MSKTQIGKIQMGKTQVGMTQMGRHRCITYTSVSCQSVSCPSVFCPYVSCPSVSCTVQDTDGQNTEGQNNMNSMNNYYCGQRYYERTTWFSGWCSYSDIPLRWSCKCSQHWHRWWTSCVNIRDVSNEKQIFLFTEWLSLKTESEV